MMKKTLFAASAAIAVVATSALPAFASGGGRVQQAPEPITVIGSMLVGGGLLAKKLTEDKDA